MGNREASPQTQPMILGAQVAKGGSGSFPCRGTDELLGVMDQVAIINSTLGKALGGASGACRLVALGSPYPHVGGPWRGLRAGKQGDLGLQGQRQRGLSSWGGFGLSSGCWSLTVPPTPSPPLPLFPGGYTTGPGSLVSLLRQRARPYLFSNSLPPAVVGCASKALDLLMENNAIVQSMAAKTQRCGPWRGWAGCGEGAGEGLSQGARTGPQFPACRPCLCSDRVPSGSHGDSASLS